MLQAILHGKARTISFDNSNNISWRELFKMYEDPLTAAFFGRVRYLSEATQRKLMTLFIDNANCDFGTIQEIKFWPRYKLDAGEVEPDVVILCENGIILIEVKLPNGQQYKDQWFKEVTSLQKAIEEQSEEFESINADKLCFVALGGNNAINIKDAFANFKHNFSNFFLCQIEWQDLFNEIDSWQVSCQNDYCIIEDWRLLFKIYNIFISVPTLEDIITCFKDFNENYFLERLAYLS